MTLSHWMWKLCVEMMDVGMMFNSSMPYCILIMVCNPKTCCESKTVSDCWYASVDIIEKFGCVGLIFRTEDSDLFFKYLWVIQNQMRWDEMRHFYDPLHPQQVPRWGRNSTQSWMFSNLDQIKQITLSCGGAEKMWFLRNNDLPSKNKMPLSSFFTSSLQKADILSSLYNRLSRRLRPATPRIVTAIPER